MKKTAAMLLTALMLGLTACSGSGDSTANDNNNEETGMTEVQSNSDNVVISFPKEAFGNASKQGIVNEAKQMNIEAVVNDDGSVEYRMSREVQQKRLEEISEGFKHTLQLIVKDKTKYPFVENIEVNDDFTELTFTYDKAGYEQNKDSFPYNMFINNCKGYQTFNEVKAENLKVTINEKDKDSGEVYNTAEY